MYLVARLFGISVYLAFLICFLYALRHFGQRNIRTVLVSFLAVLCTIAFFYVPAPEADLYRIMGYAQNFASYSWGEFFSAMVHQTAGYSSTPAAALFYRIMGLIGCMPLIAATACAVVFGILFHVVHKVQLRFQLTGAAVAMTMLWFFSADYFMPAIATIRSYIAAALVFLCIYREASHGKFLPGNLPLYMIAALTHNIGLVLIALRLGSVLFMKGKSLRYKAAYLSVLLILGIAAFPAYAFLLVKGIRKFLSYTTSPSYSYIWEQIILMVVLVTQLYTLRLARKNGCEQEPFLAVFYSVSKISTLCLLLFCYQFSILQRLSFFTALVNVPLVLYHNRHTAQNHCWSVNLYSVSSCLMLLLTCSRGYLCSLKFWI